METFIERINKLAVDSGENVPNIIGSDLVIYEFKDFVRRLEKELYAEFENSDNAFKAMMCIKKCSGCSSLAKNEGGKDANIHRKNK